MIQTACQIHEKLSARLLQHSHPLKPHLKTSSIQQKQLHAHQAVTITTSHVGK